mgnify:CR=1 FL=1
MDIQEFYQQLSSLPRTTYSFSVEQDQKIVATGRRGKAKGITFNPVTAVAHRSGHGSYGTNKRDTLKAGRALGLSKTFSENQEFSKPPSSEKKDVEMIKNLRFYSKEDSRRGS